MTSISQMQTVHLKCKLALVSPIRARCFLKKAVFCTLFKLFQPDSVYLGQAFSPPHHSHTATTPTLPSSKPVPATNSKERNSSIKNNYNKCQPSNYEEEERNSSSSNWILMSCQPHRVTSGQSNSGHKQIHVS